MSKRNHSFNTRKESSVKKCIWKKLKCVNHPLNRMETDCVSSRDRRFVSHSPVATYPPKLKSLGANQPSKCEKQA